MKTNYHSLAQVPAEFPRLKPALIPMIARLVGPILTSELLTLIVFFEKD